VGDPVSVLDYIKQLLLQHKLNNLSNTSEGAPIGPRELLPKFVGAAKKDKPFQRDLEQGYTSIPDILRQLIGTSSDYKILGAEHLKDTKIPDIDPGDLGIVNHLIGEVGIQKGTPEATRSTTVHELGHLIDRFSGELDTDEYRNAWRKEGAKSDLYGASASDEGIAELLTTLLLRGKPRLEADYKERYPKEMPQTLKITDKNLQALIKELQKKADKLGLSGDWQFR
jgi:hypothetical protein